MILVVDTAGAAYILTENAGAPFLFHLKHNGSLTGLSTILSKVQNVPATELTHYWTAVNT